MRRLLLALALVVAALAVGACSSASPGWTFAPPTVPPPATPAPSTDASATPVEPTAVPGATDAGTGGGGGGGSAVEISAINIAFEQTEVSAPADAPFTIHFNNKDAGVPHNVEIKDASGMTMFKGDIITGPAEATYSVPALPAGDYKFTCTVHPNMLGDLKVGG